MLAGRLTHWVTATATAPAAVAGDATLISAAINAATEAGCPAEAARLAHAASPVLACSLRVGVWGRVLEHGIEAAERAGLRDILAYLTHEDGVRKLVTGKRVLAATAFAAAAAYWRELGSSDHAVAADDAAQSCGGDPASGTDPAASHDGGSQTDSAAQPDTGGLDSSGGDVPDVGDPARSATSVRRRAISWCPRCRPPTPARRQWPPRPVWPPRAA